jgi:hypothetical protein
MKSAIVPMLCIVLCVAAFGIRTSGQTPRTYEIIDEGGAPPIPTVHSELPNTLTTLVVTSDYYAQPKVLVLHLFNGSGKDITGYNIIMRHKNQDGTVDKGGWSSTMSDMLSVLITTQMAKDPSASERTRLENSGNRVFPAGTGIFVAGESRDITLTGINSGSDLDAVAGAVFYVDGTYDERDKDAFKQMLTMRPGQLEQMKEEDELIRNALSDSTNEHPVAGVLTELNKRRVEAMSKPNHGFLPPMNPSNLENLQRYGPPKGMTERERLTQYVEEQEKRVELMTPHCHLEVSLK